MAHTAGRAVAHRHRYRRGRSKRSTRPTEITVTAEEDNAEEDTAEEEPTKPAEPTLLGVPTEVLVLILEFALLDENEVQLTDTTKPPGVLGVCRKVYLEARKIWYCQNQFIMTIYDCDAALLKKWDNNASWRAHVKHPDDPDLLVRLDGGPLWDNLMKWCEEVHQGTVCTLKQVSLDKATYGLFVIAAPAHEITVASRMKMEDWGACRKSLESLRRLAVAIDRRWLAGWDGKG